MKKIPLKVIMTLAVIVTGGCMENVKEEKQDSGVKRGTPQSVTGLMVHENNGGFFLSWKTAENRELEFRVFFKKGLDPYMEITRQSNIDRITLPPLEYGAEYGFMVTAVADGLRSKPAEISYFKDIPTVSLPADSPLSGSVQTTVQAGIIIEAWPVNLGVFTNARPVITRVAADSKGRFTFPLLPAGEYSVKAWADLNNNGYYDGNWLNASPEPFAQADRVTISPGRNTTVKLTLREAVTGLPEVIYDKNPNLVELYRAAWAFAREKISAGKPANGFVHAYMDEGFNNHIYQWDTCFMMTFGIYGGADFPAMNSVDNFYYKQRPSGYICRVQNEDTGKDYNPSRNDPSVNPPLFAWAEVRYLRLTGDRSRLYWALSHNHRYYRWLKNNCRTKEGYYFTSNLGSGMDNSPREGQAWGWVDMTSQMALFARMMVTLAQEAGYKDLAAEYQAEYQMLAALVNEKMWDEETGLYYDVKKNGSLHKKKTIGSFWPLLAGIADRKRTERLLSHLNNPAEFATPHLYPTLARDEKEYDKKGYYWRGAVWAPTTFMVVKGLEESGLYEEARRGALNHVSNMEKVYHEFVPERKKLPIKNPNIPWPEELDGSKQIWECYSSELSEPATRWDNTLYVRPKFVGWSGAGPIALLIENVIGIRCDATRNTITWELADTSRQGVKNIPFNGGRVSLVCTGEKNGRPVIEAEADKPCALVLIYKGKTTRTSLKKGRQIL